MATASAFSAAPELFPRYGIDPRTAEVNPWPDQQRQASIKQWCEAAWEEAEGDQKACEELEMVEKYVQYLNGKQWNKGAPSYKAQPVNNRMGRLFWELVSLLTDIRPIADVRATERKDEYIKQEEVLNGSIKAWWSNNGVETRMAMCVVYAMLTTSFAKLEWNPTLNYGLGDLALIPLNPKAVLPLKPGIDLQDSEALIYQDVKPVGWGKRKFPARAHLIRADMDASQYQTETGPPAHISPQLFSMLTPAFKRIMRPSNAANTSAYPMFKYREFWLKDYDVNTSSSPVLMGDPYANFNVAYWVRPGQLLYPRGRLIAMAGREIVHDGPNPYWHGQFPFSVLRLNVVPWSIYGMSDLRSWVDLQDIINQIFAGVIQMIKRATNPPFFAPKTAFTENVWQNLDLSMPGARMAYNAVSPHEPKVVNTAPLPGFVLPFAQNVEKEMDQQSGIAAVTEALKKKQVPGGDTLDQIRSAQQTPIRLKGRNIENFIADNGRQLVPNMFQFYNRERRVFLLGTDGQVAADYDWKPSTMVPDKAVKEEHIRKFRFTIVEGSLLSAQRTEMVANLMRLRMAGILDMTTMYDKLDKLMNVHFDVNSIKKNLSEEHAAGLGGAPSKKGAAQPPPMK